MEANVSLVGAAVFKAVILANPRRWVRFPHASAKNNTNMKINIFFNYLIKFFWLVIFFLVIFFDRENYIMVILTLSMLIITTVLTVIRSIISRNEWRQLIKDGDVEIQEKIKF